MFNNQMYNPMRNIQFNPQTFMQIAPKISEEWLNQMAAQAQKFGMSKEVVDQGLNYINQFKKS